MSKSIRVLAPLANGFEEIEFVSTVDILRRAGIEVLIAGINGKGSYKGAHNIDILAPFSANEITPDNLSGIALAGGMQGMLNLKQSLQVLQIIKTLHSQNKLISAICASPIVLNEAGILSGEFTCYPGCEEGLNGNRINKAVVVNNNVITSAGPASAVLFALEIVKYLCGESVYKELYSELLVPLVKS